MFGTGATEVKAEGWSRTYGLYLPDQITLFLRKICLLHGRSAARETHDLEMFVWHETALEGR